MSTDEIHEVSGGDIVLWTDHGSSIHIKVKNSLVDPIELNAEEPKELGELLMKLAKEIE
jgi:hypothetical protein